MNNKKNEVVISGIGGKFPECNNYGEFKQKLFSKSTLLTPDPAKSFNENQVYTGKIPDWNKFDHSFFGVTTNLVRNADPLMGLMLERTFEAIVDAATANMTYVSEIFKSTGTPINLVVATTENNEVTFIREIA